MLPDDPRRSAHQEALPQWQVDNIGASTVQPRLQELDEMERNGMRSQKMSAIRKEEWTRAVFPTVNGWQKFLENELTPAERQYILAAEDAGMIPA